MKLTYDVADKPKGAKLLTFALQQMLAILAATIAVPMIVGNGMTPAAAMFGAGAGTIIYQIFTRRKSPVFLGSSFAFLGSMSTAFAGAVSMQMGFLGLILGAFFAGAVYVLISIIINICGINWLNKLMPPVVIGPTVAIIGLSLAGNAVGDLQTGDVKIDGAMAASPYAAIVCGLITLFTVMLCASYGKKSMKLIPFIIGIAVGYAVALIMTLIGNAADINGLKLIDLSVFSNYMAPEGKIGFETFFSIPKFTFIEAFKGFDELTSTYIFTLMAAYVPVAMVVFAEHVADHKNLSSIIDKDLLKDPGLNRTLLGNITEADQKSFDDYIKETYHADEDEE